MADGFLGRWSRRKLDAKEGRPAQPEPAPPADPSPGSGGSAQCLNGEPVHDPSAAPVAQADGEAPRGAPAPVRAAEPAPSLEDARALTPQSDFTRFVRSDVPAEVKNAAMKKLFADPHFNVMDGLDVYIDDYNKADPLPESVVRQLASVQFLGLFREHAEGQDQPPAGPRDDADGAPPASVAQCAEPQAADECPEPPPQAGPDHGHADLRLQPDDAAGRPGPGPGTG